jgi:transposase
MRIISGVVPGVSRLAGLQVELSRKARQRLKWFDYYNSHGRNARLTCRYFGISPQTFYRWKRRYNPKHLASLEERSHRPKHLRQPTYSVELVEAVLGLREEYPRWGKDKLVVLLQGKGFNCSTSTVGRIIHRLKDRGVLKEPVPNHISARKRQRQRPYAVRKPKDYKVTQPGELVQLDTLDIRPLPGVVLKHFTAHDVISR